MEKDAVNLEERLKALQNVYERIGDMIDTLPDIVPESIKSVIKDGVLGDKKLKEFIEEIKSSRPPRFMLIGRTGVGKSSMINALCGSYTAPVSDVSSCTPFTSRYPCKDHGRTLIEVLDTRGIQESLTIDGTVDAEKQLLADAIEFNPDVAILMLSCTHRDSMDDDIDYLQKLITEYEKLNGKDSLPVIVVLTKADAVPPPYLVLPEKYTPGKIKTINAIEKHVKEVIKSKGLKLADKVITISSYVDWADEGGALLSVGEINELSAEEREKLVIAIDGRYHIEELRSLLDSAILDIGARQGFRMAYRLNAVIENSCSRIVNIFSGIAGTIALTPIPVSDIYILVILQALMVVIISMLSGRDLSINAAIEFIVSLGGISGVGFALRILAQQAAKFINAVLPGTGSVISGLIASAGTYGMGRAAIAYYVNDGTVEQARKEMKISRTSKEKELDNVRHFEKSNDPDKNQKIKEEIDRVFSLT